MTRGGVRMLAIVVVVSLLCAARDADAQGPFQFGRPDSSGPFSVSRLRSWLNAVRGHDAGAMDVYAIVRQWYVSVAAFLQWRHEIESAPKFLETALSLFSSARDLLMISGCVHEYVASPRVQNASDLPQRRVGDQTGHLRQAERAYRQVIALGTPGPFRKAKTQ